MSDLLKQITAPAMLVILWPKVTARKAWLDLALTAADLLIWAQPLCFTGGLARCESATSRHKICAIAAKLTRSD